MKKLNFSVNEARAVTMLEKTLNVASAAKRLDVSPNALNISISRVEQKIHRALFVRKQKTGEVTIAPGVEFILSYMNTITNAADLIEDENKTWSSETTGGQIILTTSQTIMEYVLGPYFVEFVNKSPQLNVSIKQQDDWADYTPATNEICITSCQEIEEGYTYFPFHSFVQRYWASKKYIERFGSPQTMDDLFHHRVLLRKDLKDPRMLFASVPISQVFPHNTLKGYEIQGARVLDFLCERGLGIMAASEEMIKLSKLKVENLFPKTKGEKMDVFVKANKEFLKTPIARYFIDWLFECRDKIFVTINTKPSYSYKKQYS
ncbi:MAG: LysR family transcriptional regulator [Alphaproteobacteria bacterium]|nr:LysR family transcriptional regulator [Alphaproteobacteria bacterium]